MGFGDNIMATGMAKGAAARGKRIAFGNNAQIIWDTRSATIFAGNPNIAPPGSERDKDIEWIEFYRGNRIYNYHDQVRQRWKWNYSFRPIPGEIYFTIEEQQFAQRYKPGFIAIEADVPRWKTAGVNKQWPRQRYDAIARLLKSRGYDVYQFVSSGPQLRDTKPIKAPTFRHALAVLKRAALYLGPEGGLHHGAAALGVPAVVIFGGWIPPQVTGYDMHINLSYGKACGSLLPCFHCTHAMDMITERDVWQAVKQQLREREIERTSNSNLDLGQQIR